MKMISRFLVIPALIAAIVVPVLATSNAKTNQASIKRNSAIAMQNRKMVMQNRRMMMDHAMVHHPMHMMDHAMVQHGMVPPAVH